MNDLKALPVEKMWKDIQGIFDATSCEQFFVTPKFSKLRTELVTVGETPLEGKWLGTVTETSRESSDGKLA